MRWAIDDADGMVFDAGGARSNFHLFFLRENVKHGSINLSATQIH
jgi:hypothetical protein